MPKYLCLQRALPGGAGEQPSPAQMQAMYEKFNAWRESVKENLIDLGGGLGASRLVTAGPAPDGPFVEVKELVGGYMVITATNMDEAIEVARGCPGLVQAGSGVEVFEIHAP
jgi:hypothetical protein